MYKSFGIIIYFISAAYAVVNHWTLKDERITPKIDSPFHLREPDNLVAFLQQVQYNDYVEASYAQLLKQRNQITEHIRFSVKYGEDLVEQAKCAVNFYILEKSTSYLQMTTTYMNRFELSELNQKFDIKSGEPICENDKIDDQKPTGYEHLESFKGKSLKTMHIEPEVQMDFSVISTVPIKDLLRSIAIGGMSKKGEAWKYYTLSSYYWRLQGDAQKAFECARKAIPLTPLTHKDMPLLSLGTILFRAGRTTDAEVLLTAATTLAPNVCENHFVLGSFLAMQHEFKRALICFDDAERVDPSIIPKTLPVRNFINCLDNLNKKTSKMHSYVDYMKNEVKKFKKLKQKIAQNHEKLVQQQVPLAVRYSESNISNPDLLQRGQYCSKRTVSATDKPVLVCDFYSDIQMRLESNDVDIESLERELKITSEAVIKQVSAELKKKLNSDNVKTTKVQITSSKRTKSP
ncbi:tetratricopeptide repeat protein 17-like [Teleopsis dalmanni]|uniref:tetratricopeptide repeat protein 17-like n=1 Tax=Teleopsis dalmanni TaxID=139649 RepID=UPI0018CE7E3F|nr:tetratricopeptide repeat protein 17-like [Teleopsis dalmanni]XP_037936700.1 tetratricopeptide repeat protein 17-like [Teleopsis dalmanni]